MRDDKFIIFHLIFVEKLSDEKVHKIIILGKHVDFVCDIETAKYDFNCGMRKN